MEKQSGGGGRQLNSLALFTPPWDCHCRLRRPRNDIEIEQKSILIPIADLGLLMVGAKGHASNINRGLDVLVAVGGRDKGGLELRRRPVYTSGQQAVKELAE